MKRVVIVGGGITGLATAKALLDLTADRRGDLSITLLEQSQRLGGSIVSERRDGFVIDGGPDSWIVTKPQATALAKSLGLEGELMPTIEATRRVYVAWKDELHPLPEGLVLAVPTRVRPILESGLFSWAGKARMGMEPLVPAKDWSGDADESIADFISRRLGQEVTDRLAAPLLGGIFAGDAARISVRATFPQFVEAEKKHGSLIRAMRAQRREQRERAGAAAGKGAPSAFLSLRAGMGTLIDALTSTIERRVEIRRGTSVVSLAKVGEAGRADARGRYAVTLEGGESLFADDVVLAAPAHRSAGLLRALDADAASELDAIPYVSTATVFLAFDRSQIAHPLDAVGFIVPRALGRPLLAATWVSSKWESRAPEGKVLMRVFFGGAWGEETLEKDDPGLVRVALGELRALMGVEATPLFTRVFRFQRSNPQPVIGHLARMAKLRASLGGHPGIHVAGSGVDGIGIPDCIRQGEAVAARIAAL